MIEHELDNVDAYLTTARAHLVADNVIITISYNGGPVREGLISITDDREMRFDPNEASATITPPWEVNLKPEPDYENVSLTVFHDGEHAYLAGEPNRLPAYSPIYLLDENNHLYRADYNLGAEEGDYFDDFDIPEMAQYYTITDTGTGLTKAITGDDLEDLYTTDMSPVIKIT